MEKQINQIEAGLSILGGVSTLVRGLAFMGLEDAPALRVVCDDLEKAYVLIDQANDTLRDMHADKLRDMSAEAVS